MPYDLAIIGGGIVGLSTALEISTRLPGLSIVVLEKEAAVAMHQTGRNSGVIHAGVYYQPGSLKARFCREGVTATIDFCREYGVPFEQCGKMLVATSVEEMPRLAALEERCRQNGLPVERLDAAELVRREPHIHGIAALFVPTSGIVDYGRIARTMADGLTGRGVDIRTSATVETLREEADGIRIQLPQEEIGARHVIACAGIMADRLALLCGLALDFRIVPFRGEYYRLRSDKDAIVNHLIYPIPDPALPFLGVHLTKMIGGYVTVGPNAVLAFAREGYRFSDVGFGDLKEMISFPGFRRLVRNNFRSGLSEMANSLSKRRYLALCRRYCPELRLDDLQPYRPGIRAQAVLADGSLVHDFLILQTRRTIHVCNAPSPAATSAIPIARHLADRAAALFEWRDRGRIG
ncbi:hydroxyglutarate oxidase [Rhizobium sp. Leaf384]|uniref:L-2-hydroxyglutarate oxidase n=1 Tax=unclassified Rhizobium TaxID=2613769 RepID=UPI0007137FDA|nr:MULTISPECIES: L-2-hydroxyglutarate oxidase [unclassified Rhizobium]KQS78907.1 hydroxyglutarate oxidase [Rhizobium sp. Leaf384]KQS85457.1 hydroxyglutarate oxidase [Rhizobium sp. Leaf383]